MINYDSIISAYKDRPTLMQWLKKVEEALKGASATSFSVNKKGSATISFQINFDDGTSLESGEIILQQGESVQSAAIVNGHLILTLSNGDRIDAGNLGAVSGFSIDASQHLIVTYQDGTTNDLGAIFNGNVNISGVLTASSVSTPLITSAGANVEFAKPIDVDVLTSSEDSIAAQKPVIETMTGYSFDNPAFNGYRGSVQYASAVKNGNKLTFAVAFNIERLDGPITDYNPEIGRFSVPHSIVEKLAAAPNISWTGFLGGMSIALFETGTSATSFNAFVYKNDSANQIVFKLISGNTLSVGTIYSGRMEFTALLSENLAA